MSSSPELTNQSLWSTWFKNGDFKNHIINENNIPITKEFIESIFKKYNFKHKVQNLELFQLAMVHISYLDRTTLTEKTAKLLKEVIPISDDMKDLAMPLKKKCYGVLEFRGDAVIHDIIAEYLMNRYPDEDEGFLTKLRTKLERDETLSYLSKKIGLDKYVVIARNIEQSGGRLNNVHLTEDAFESFFGALKNETTYEKCAELLISIIQEEIDIAELINNDDNYKDRLMRAFHKEKWNEPKYIEDKSLQTNIKDGCQEIRSYTTYVQNPDGKIIGVGVGNTKIKSEQNAAYNSLIALNMINDNDSDSDYYGELNNSDDEYEINKKTKNKELSNSSDSSYYD
jgi:ribonuclease-3